MILSDRVDGGEVIEDANRSKERRIQGMPVKFRKSMIWHIFIIGIRVTSIVVDVHFFALPQYWVTEGRQVLEQLKVQKIAL